VLTNPRSCAVKLTLDQCKFGWANALSDEEAKDLYESYHVAAPGVALMQMANANINPRTEAKLDPANPDRASSTGEGPHDPMGNRQRLLQAAASQLVRDRDREDPQPRPFADHRQRMTAAIR
jgi:hypothetical protein